MRYIRETIRKLVGYLNDSNQAGGFWLPNIQRSFVWKEEQITRLYDSITREYPIGSLLAWKTKNRIRYRKFIDHYRSKMRLTDFFIPEDDCQKTLVLDGQQRLQSLFIGLKGSYDKKELYLDILSGDVAPPDEIKYRFKFIDPPKAAWPFVKVKDIVFSQQELTRIAREIIALQGNTLTQAQKERVEDNVSRIYRIFCVEENLVYEEVDSIDRPNIYSEDDVVEVFIRANSAGTPLGKSDLLFALLTARWDDAYEEMEDLLEDLNSVGYEFSRDFLIKTCLTILDKGAAYEIRKLRDVATRDEIITKWAQISDAVKDVKDFLYGKTYIRSDKALPSYLMLIPLVYFRYHYPDQWNTSRRLDDYVLTTSITGAFSGNPDDLIDKINKQTKETGCFEVDGVFDIIKSEGRNLEVASDTILDQKYGSSYVHLLFNLWYKDFNYTPSYTNSLPDVDHIFPQSQLRKIRDVNPETGRRSLMKYKQEVRDQIANLMLLTQDENRGGGKGDTLPELWFEDKNDEYLNRHLIPRNRDLWKLENFEEFIEERKKLIVQKFHSLILR